MAATLPRNAELAEQLELLADLLELEGEDTFRVLAYRRAATRIRETAGPVAQLALDGKAKELPGIGKTIEEKIVADRRERRDRALTKRKALGARPRWSPSCGCRASARRRRAGSGRSSASRRSPS